MLCSDANHTGLVKWVMLMVCVVLVHRDFALPNIADIGEFGIWVAHHAINPPATC